MTTTVGTYAPLDRAEASASLEAALSKIRHHINSKLENQKQPALLLSAVEATLKEQQQLNNGASTSRADSSNEGSQGLNPTEYLLALESMLDKASSSDAAPSLYTSVLYLLAIVAPVTAPAVLRARASALLAAILPLLSNPHSHSSSASVNAENQAAQLRSALTVLQAVLLSHSGPSDRAVLDSDDAGLREGWAATLHLCSDARPKVRKRAQDVVSAVLDQGDAHNSASAKAHPYAARTADWAIKALQGVADAGSAKGKAKGVSSAATAPEYDRRKGQAKGASAAAAARQQTASDGGASAGIWVCGFLKQLAPTLPGKHIAPLCNVLLRLPSLANPFLTSAAFSVFEALFKPSKPQVHPASLSLLSAPSGARTSRMDKQGDSLVRTLDALCSSSIKPSANDAQLLPPYMRALENALVAYSRVDGGMAAWTRVPTIWSEIVEVSLSARSKASREQPAIRSAGRDALCAIARYCVPDAAIEQTLQASGAQAIETPLGSMLALLADALGKQALRYNHARAEVLNVLIALVMRLRYRSPSKTSSRSQPAAAQLMLPIVSVVADLRAQPEFEHREAADGVIAAAVEVCGPRLVLDKLPLGLNGEKGATTGRAWLLPLMRNRITNTELSHFTQSMVPLSEVLFNKRAAAEEPGPDGKPKRPVEAKVYEALTEQVWALFPAYCDMPTDLIDAVDEKFVALLSNVLYSQPTLRPSVCRGLQLLVERNEALSSSGAPSDTLVTSFGVDQVIGKANIAHLAKLAPQLLAVFFNIFSQSPSSRRGFIAEALAAYLRVMKPKDIRDTFERVVAMLQEALPNLQHSPDKEAGPNAVPPVPHTMLDLLIALIPFLDASSEAHKLFDLALGDDLLLARDSGLQKKTYRILARLIEGPRGLTVLRLDGGAGRVRELLLKLNDTSSSVVSGAKRDRVAVLSALVPRIPSQELHFLPSIIPEAVLSTKEANQGTRTLAYELLVGMGHKMQEGGTIRRDLVETALEGGDAEMDSAEVANASIEEYVTMVAAGLAGSTPHMISATITALSRLLYEFHESMPGTVLTDLLQTLEVFVRSANREIVKSALGFVKVVIVVLPHAIMDGQLPNYVSSLFSLSPQNRQHFKAKVRHIFERLIRRFGYARVEQLTDDENKKLLVNIKKRKERARRRKNAQDDEANDDDDDDGQGPAFMGARALRRHGVDAFQEAIYGSESDLSDSGDDDAHEPRRPAGGRRARTKEEQTYIREDDDEVMDLLDRSVAAGGGISTSRGGRPIAGGPASTARRPGQDASRFELDEATGRMLIDDPEGGKAVANVANVDVDADGAGRAYVDRERGTGGVQMRGGVARMNKNNKRNRAEDAEMELEQMAAEIGLGDEDGGSKRKRKEKKQKESIGKEFRAKKAEGDVKRNDGPSPYAYVPLSAMGGKHKQKDILSITGKGRKTHKGRS
ncbi:NUC173-domain-containing protein [Ceraceosorus guamensis]|uniref:NUC173-domain-containing protein n=1 Tax=Ceraceosorus guamensis TaxID=1522189 RepID=A0A316VP04_9BASI|nr:NUC173-domain-containing protein [Ceraceosorus guamensis]PWN39044.1 NUC173-domain-containing protein [Ceraceosorus guamensis]